MTNDKNFDAATEKQDWVRPSLQRLQAGSAESGESGRTDASAPQAS